MKALEANFDGLIGPTHNYSGLSYGNLASAANRTSISNPKEAALQGLKKMKKLSALGLVQGVFPPHARPHLTTLRALGFRGSDKKVVSTAAKTAPELLRSVYTAAAMWTANAATVSPSADTEDNRVHFTPANLAANFHRSIESKTTARILKAIFRSEKHFAHHSPLPGGVHMGDEGAANHCRFSTEYGERGVELFVYGKSTFHKSVSPEKFPGRQTREACEAVARLHRLDASRVCIVQQSPKAIDGGVFHNDVVAVSNKNVFFYHQEAYENSQFLERTLRAAGPDIDFHFIQVPFEQVSLADAVKSYLFNSQLLSLPKQTGMTLLVPGEARELPSTARYLKSLVRGEKSGLISNVEFIDVHESMRNGGGPACLRMRVVLNELERNALNGQVLFNDDLYKRLSSWIEKYYRDRITSKDLLDPDLMEESFSALDSLTGILGLGAIYEFQF